MPESEDASMLPNLSRGSMPAAFAVIKRVRIRRIEAALHRQRAE
jgi:hypothetical protein